jgi:hypothetical protein
MGRTMMEGIWKTSVNELFIIFRGALLSIIPWLEKARIKWKEGESYDDLDNIVKVLYENIVCSSLVGEVLTEYSIAKYDIIYDDYSGIDYIKVNSKEHPDKNLSFISFQSEVAALDKIRVAVLNNADKVIGKLSLKFKEVEFAFVKNKDDNKEIIENINVIL